ncbi:MAG: flagellar assembly protein FliW [Thermodesulfobacteria bacterium]|nr:flagellar assembly protein FliW [Thermodesulfobacteriota bacterium]
MEIETTRFGKIEIDEKKIIFFPSGILGFPEAKRYVLIPHKEGSPFFWLQAIDVPELAFVVVDPKLFFPDYHPKLPLEAKKELHLHEDDELCFLTIVTIPKENPEEMTVNLLGPIAVNVSRKLAKQVVLDSRRYPLREPLRPHLHKLGQGERAEAEDKA